jgi:tRNA pseudouridine38-40 synthase
MPERTIQLILHYDGAQFAGWQRQPDMRTVQGVLEETLGRLCATPVAALGAGRTDAGVHARGQAAGVRVAAKWTAGSLRRALNATLPADVWVASAHEMRGEFHARYSARARGYRYVVGTDEGAHSPFRRRWEWAYVRPVDEGRLAAAAEAIVGDHSFRAFAVRGTAPESDDHRCVVTRARWRREGDRLLFEVEANRFLHHMVRFLVGTMLDEGSGRRAEGTVRRLLDADDNREVSPPAPPHALYLERVEYPPDLYLPTPDSA